jgi:DNA-binding transcriptional regulator YiaG
MKERKYYSEASMVAHEMARDLYQIGAINDARMREYDEMCLVREPEAVKETAETGKMDHISPITAEI